MEGLMKKKQYTLVHPSPEFPPMPPEKRKPFLPRHGYCSIAPANQYIDGLCAAGNGRKIFVYGHPYHDTMVCQHEEFYWTKFQEPLQVPELKHILPEVRRLLLEGKSKEANMLSMIEAEKCGYKGLADGAYPYDYYWTHPACVMHLDTEEDSNTQDYLRTMNYENGEASVYFTDRRGTYARHAFTSVSREIHVQKVETVSGTPLNYTFSVSTDVSEGTHVWENLNSPEGIVSHVERDGLLLMQGSASGS